MPYPWIIAGDDVLQSLERYPFLERFSLYKDGKFISFSSSLVNEYMGYPFVKYEGEIKSDDINTVIATAIRRGDMEDE